MSPDRRYDSLRSLEAFHVRLLLQLSADAKGALYLKGGVNLRLFYGSPRYSEDMDFDAEARVRERLRSVIPKIISHPQFVSPLRDFGLRGVVLREGPTKDTATTLRFKMGLDLGGDTAEPTKVEISFRSTDPGAPQAPEPATSAEPVASVAEVYVPRGTSWAQVRHYPHASTIWQKLRALALRTEVQARDVFDLHHLMHERFGRVPETQLRAHLSADLLQQAEDRTMDVDPGQFAEKVVRYLPEEIRDELIARWDDMRTEVAYQIRSIKEAKPALIPPSVESVQGE